MKRVFQKFKQDVSAILWISGALILALSLASYHPQDPSLNSLSSQWKANNWFGLLGSFLSDLFYHVFGICAWLPAAAFARRGILVFRGEAEKFWNLRTLWGFLIILISATWLSVTFSEVRIFDSQLYLGGLLGWGLAQATLRILNPVGVQVVLLSSLLILVLFWAEKTLQELLQPLPQFSLRAPFSRLFSPLSRRQPDVTLSKRTPASLFPLSPSFPEKISGQTSPTNSDSAPPLFQLKSSIPESTDLKIHANIEALGLESKKNIFKPKIQRKIENWDLPKLALLEDPPSSRLKIDEKEIKRKAELLKEKMAHFAVTGEVVAARPGPAVTLFEFKPDADVKLSKITELADDLSLALASESLRIIAPIPGRDVVGIETSNHQRETVFLKDMLQEEAFWRHDMKLPVSLGKQVDGKPNLIDLRRLPHLMVAGTTGSGKSVFVVSALIGLLFKHSPQTLRLLIIDPKQVDLAAFEKLPHLVLPLVTDSREAVSALKWAVNEMEKRYRSMSEFSARGLETYNEATATLSSEEILRHEKLNLEYESTPGRRNDTYYFRPLPYLVIVIEEFGDLMSVDKANVEHSVVRLAQKARACGIHLILAMQSPRKEVVTGLIKTNIPGRISFKVSSTMDSRIILDDTGADRLLAQGDLLFRNPGGANLLRHHAPFLKDQEVLQICDFWSQQSPPQYDEVALKSLNTLDNEGDELGEIEAELDEKYDEILAWASTMKEISASLIQRRFQLGYPRAARLIESFERQGVVGPAQGSKPRTVLISSFEHLDTPLDPR